MPKKAIAILLSLILVIAALPMTASASAEETDYETPGISIERAYLRAGDSLKVSNAEGFALRFFVDDELVSEDSLVLSSDYYEKWIVVKAYDGDEPAGEDRVYFSKLPVLYINTDDGEEITSKTEYKSGDMFIQNNLEVSQPMYSGVINIRGRGNSTWKTPKKPYRIKLDKKTDLFGMGKNKNWVLLANYIDESLMRNNTANHIAGELGLDYMNSVWTDVVINGEYAGNYQLCEQIRIDEDRVDIFDWEDEAESIASAVNKAEKKNGVAIDKDALEDQLKEDLSWVTSGVFEFGGKTYTVADYYDAESDISGGYLFELSEDYDEVSEFKTNSGLCVMLKSPEYLNTNSDMMDYARQYWQQFENAYRSEDGYADTPEGRKHYSELADIDTMASYWLVMEITDNVDSMFRSRYAYKDIDGLLKFGPVWDYDYSLGTMSDDLVATGWRIPLFPSNQNFFMEFLDDPLFISKAVEKYWEIRPYLESLIEPGGILDSEFDYIKESGIADAARWDRKDSKPMLGKSLNKLIITPLFGRGFVKDASVMKSFLSKRVEWLDKQFASETTLMNSTFTLLSASPYVKASRLLPIEIKNASRDNAEHAPADASVATGGSAVVTVSVKDRLTASLDVYINGLYRGNYPVGRGNVTLVIDGGELYEEENRKNVISVIGRTKSGETTLRNYATLIHERNGGKNILGDADCDGEVTILDATAVQRSIVGLNTPVFVKESADADRDGDITSVDATHIQRHVSGVPTSAEAIGELI